MEHWELFRKCWLGGRIKRVRQGARKHPEDARQLQCEWEHAKCREMPWKNVLLNSVCIIIQSRSWPREEVATLPYLGISPVPPQVMKGQGSWASNIPRPALGIRV